MRRTVADERLSLFSSCVRGWDARRVIEAAKFLRLGVVEWGTGPGEALGTQAAGVPELCAAAGMAVSGLAVQESEVTLATPRRFAQYVRLARALGARHIRLFAPPYRGGVLTREMLRARAGVDALVDLCAPAGLAVLVETAPETLAPSPELAVSLVEHHPPERAGVLYDPGNTVIEGYVSPELAVARLGAHLHHVHVKNIAWAPRRGAWEWRYVGLNAGLLDWRELLEATTRAGYAGCFSIDHLGGRPTLTLLQAETVRLRGLLAEVAKPKGGAPSLSNA